MMTPYMKIPATPPDWARLFRERSQEPGTIEKLVAPLPEDRGKRMRYYHWDEILRHEPPPGLDHELWWLKLKFARSQQYRTVPLKSTSGQSFKFTDAPLQEFLHRIDQDAGGKIEVPEEIVNPSTKDRYYISSIIEEAITSSQLEGAATTRQVAKEMIRTDRKPKDIHERMILNNFRTMKRIREFQKDRLSPEVVFEIHRSITKDTLDDPSSAGRIRLDTDGQRVVRDTEGTIYHTPPAAEDLAARIQLMCDFANGEVPDIFIHPAIRAIILHFWLAYDHPFVDGNGRTARALFYWSLLRNKYWLVEFVSISNIILRAPKQYYRAFLHTETDEFDLTYFIVFNLRVLIRAIEQLHAYIERKSREVRELQAHIRATSLLNHRQRALISHALKHPGAVYTHTSHQRSHSIAYGTSRSDLFELVEKGLLEKGKSGKLFVYRASTNLEQKLRELSADWQTEVS
jgi:Fic family protein